MYFDENKETKNHLIVYFLRQKDPLFLELFSERKQSVQIFSPLHLTLQEWFNNMLDCHQVPLGTNEDKI